MIPFTKMQGIGNDFVLLDEVGFEPRSYDPAALAKSICDRRFGVGADGLVLVGKGVTAPFAMRMLNPDGSESEMCGNAVRCVAKFLVDRAYASEFPIELETGNGLLRLEITTEGHVKVDMGSGRIRRGEIGMTGPENAPFLEQPLVHGLHGTAVSMGNPHLVIFVEDVASVPLADWGPELELHRDFPHRTNVHFVQVQSRDYLIQRTWERGAGATLACGTGACAALVAASLTDRTNRAATIRLPGGELKVRLGANGHVFMTGPAETVFEGEFPFAEA